jgi:AraC-like DNA-binding protein
MPSAAKYRSQPWLRGPLRTAVGEIELAGLLQNVRGIDPANMRILRRFALVLMVEGRGYYHDARGVEDELAPGDVVLVFPELAHAYGSVGHAPWTQVYVVFDGPQFQLWRAQGLLSPERPVLRVGPPDYWRRRLEETLRSDRRPGPGGALRAVGGLVQLVAEMIAADGESGRGAGRDGWLDRSVRLLGERAAGGWLTPQTVAAQVGLSYENFRKRFAALTGESPGRYQRRRRLEWACAAIYHGEVSLKQIADSLGFCDVFHFSKAFKQEIGLTPSAYRRRVRGR